VLLIILLALTSAGNLVVVVPIGFFLAIMLGLGRLYHESEMAAIQSCGVGPAGLYRPIALLGVFVVVLLTWLSFFAIPSAAARAQAIRAEAMRDAQFGSLEPGRFRTFGGGNVVFYAESVDDNGILHNVNVFVEQVLPKKPAEGSTAPVRRIESKRPSSNPSEAKPSAPKAPVAKLSEGEGAAQKVEENKLEIWVATRAEQRGAGQPEQTFVLYDGVRYEGIPGSGEFRTIRFSEGGIPIRLGSPNDRAPKPSLKMTAELWKSRTPADVAELHWRLATPLMALILMVLAVPLARLRPRQGRFGKIGAAILSFFIYYQLLVAGRTWMESGAMPSIAGLWWVHALALCGAIWLLARESPPGRPRLVAAGA